VRFLILHALNAGYLLSQPQSGKYRATIFLVSYTTSIQVAVYGILTPSLFVDSWLPRSLNGMALPNSHASGNGIASRRTRLPRLRPNGEYIDPNQAQVVNEHLLINT
jgi:hypothetical protein